MSTTESPAPEAPKPGAPAPETSSGRSKLVQARLGDQTFALTLLSQIKREDLHGKSALTPMKGDTTLKRAYLRPNGQVVRNADRKLVDADPEGSIVEKAMTTKVNAPTELKPAITEAGMQLTPAKVTDLAEFAVDRFLAVEVVGLAVGLYRTTYNLKPTTEPEDAILVVKEKGEAFLLIGQIRLSTFVGDIPNYEFFAPDADETATEEGGDELAIGF